MIYFAAGVPYDKGTNRHANHSTPELEHVITDRLEAGFYQSPVEVVRDALRALELRDRLKSEQLEIFLAEFDRRIAALNAGENVDCEDLFSGLERLEHPARLSGRA